MTSSSTKGNGQDRAPPADDFTRGYLIAVANIMHTHGEDVIAEDVLSELGETEGVLRRLGFDSFDAVPLRKLFREIARKRRMKEQRRFAAENRERIEAEWDALTDPRVTIRNDVAAAKARADAEWDALPDGRPWRIEDHIEGRKLP